MNDSDFVQILDGVEQLLQYLAGLKLRKFLIFDDVLKQLTSAGVLSDQVVVLLVLQYFVELDYVRVSNLSENLQLLAQSSVIPFCDNFILGDNLDCNLLVGGNMSCYFDFVEGSLAYCLAHEIVA
jgi:hypothetical protein